MRVVAAIRRARAVAWDAAGRDVVLVRGLAVALSLRMLLLPFFSDPLNFYGFHLTASIAGTGVNPWIAIASDPALASFNPWGYPPAYLLPAMAADALSFGNGYLFGIWIRVPLILATLVTSLLLFRIGREYGLEVGKARLLALLYAFLPFTLLVDTVWGSNDPLAVMFATGAVYFAVRSKPRFELAAVLLGLGMAFKIYPIVLWPLLAAAAPGMRDRLRVVVMGALPVALSAGPVLVASPVEFLRTLGLFVTGGQGDTSSLSFAWLVRTQAGVTHPAVTLVPAAVFAGLLAFLTWSVARRRISLLGAATSATMAVFLVAPRLNANYYLWAVPLLMAAAAVGLWPRAVAWIANLTWLPFGVVALIYNGASGVTGFAYWALVAGAPRGQPYLLFPWWTAAVLVGAFLVMAGVAVASLVVWPSPHTGAAPLRWRVPFGRALLRRAAPLFALSTGATIVGAALVASMGANVLPEDFGTYATGEGRVALTDEFNSALFGFTYGYGGSGFFWLNETGSGALEVDTGASGGNAYIARQIPNKTVDLSFRLRIERLDGTAGPLILARLPAGWVGVIAANGTLHLVYHDDQRLIRQDFGTVPLYLPLEISATISPQFTEVRYGGLVAYASGSPPRVLLLGHFDKLEDAGGRIAIDRLSLAWESDPRGNAPAVVVGLLGGTTLALALPVWQWRRRTG